MLKDIVEHPSADPTAPSSPQPPQPPAPGGTGFPVPLHRSQRPSAFARARKAQQDRQTTGKQAVGFGTAVESVPAVQVDKVEKDVVGGLDGPGSGSGSEWEQVREQVNEENKRTLETMTSKERSEEVEELRERFGSKVMGLMQKRADARQNKTSLPQASAPSLPAVLEPVAGVDTKSILQEVSEENEKRIKDMSAEERTQEMEELRERLGDHVLEGLRRRAEARLRKGKQGEAEQVIKSKVHTSTPPTAEVDPKPKSHESAKLEWLKPITTPSNDSSTRFDLSGAVLSTDAKASLPTHLGLHHHGESPDLAGYTLQDILYLCRSTVPSQRITMMGVLSKIIAKLNNSDLSQEVAKECEKEGIVQQAIEMGIDVLAGLTRGAGVIRASVDLLFEALGGPSWSWLDDSPGSDTYQASIPTPLSANADPIGIASIPFDDVLPRLSELLSMPDALPPTTTHQLLLILRRATLLPGEMCETLCPIVPVVIKHHVVQRAWPPRPDNSPSTDAIRFLRSITASSRACAEELLSERVYETILKFVVTATWGEESGVEAELGQLLALEVLRVYGALGRYGLSASVVTSSGEVWRLFGAWVRERSATQSSPLEQSLIEAYFNLLSIWTTCAIDPHRTTPEHDITWAQVSALSWQDEVISAAGELVKQTRLGEVAAAMSMLVSWTSGAKVNGARAGEEEKQELLESLRSIGLRESIEKLSSGNEEEVKLCAAAVRLHTQLQPVGMLLSEEVLATLRHAFMIPTKSSHRSATYLRHGLLRLGMQDKTLSSSDWLPIALDLFLSFQIGDEPLALELVDDILRSDWSSSAEPIARQYASLAHADRLEILRPLLQFTILPDVEHVIAPREPSHIYLKATASLRAPPATVEGEKGQSMVGLPLQADWLFSPLNELLRSGSSSALAQVPPDWSASETEIVQSVLLLGQLQCAVMGWEDRLGRSRVAFNMMKVFMLEHGQQGATTTSESEVFRDAQVALGMSRLMAHLTNPMTSSGSLMAPIESVSLPFLGAGVPFFQFYTDFIALYEAISFSDLLFSQLLLPPLAMSYSMDYRKLLWNDHATALRGMRMKMDEAPVEDVKGLSGYFEPRETSAEVLSGYARALSRGWILEDRNPFLFHLAVHHLAATFWEGTEEAKDSTRVGLLVGLLATGSDALLRRLLEWNLSQRGEGVVTGDVKQERKETVTKLTGARGTQRVEGL
ncbi:hypothetical protein L202_03024 [Cryptococcus amylolentus CBS 6039]|uniref:Uncharacterized protein n=1 Tax=Cryptococcus amylolentus CBS 6039 TaxID=1295533 RepID=A0A1E3HYU0_9TREE|nr:hypothetical protein L202_03024 [Cryptococcus amylolentus CBS 6039]ODN80896.1 hypothetical protein L202_03024 [Cryptococcus amylolentus CBS 6039]